MKSSEVEKKLNVLRTTLRYYEDEGFIQPQRDENGYRNYSEEDINKLKLILQLRSMEIPIDDIKAIMQGKVPLEEYLNFKKVSIEEEKRNLKDIENKVKHFQKNKPVLLAIEQTNKVCIGDVGKYWIDNIEKRLTIYDSSVSFYEKVIQHKGSHKVINYEDIEFVEINYSQFDAGYWGKNFSIFLNAHLHDGKVITFHGCIECDKYHFVLAVGMLKKAGILIVDKYNIYEKALNADEKVKHMYEVMHDL